MCAGVGVIQVCTKQLPHFMLSVPSGFSRGTVGANGLYSESAVHGGLIKAAA